jgi:hypothetical protein
LDLEKLEQLGDELRGVGHRRRKLVEQVYQEIKEGDQDTSKELYQELSEVSDKAIGIIEEQKQIFDEEVRRL